jgi:general secretion pathway protein D
MKRFLALMLLLASVTAQAQDKLKPVAFELASISVAQVVQLIYSEAMTTPYVLDPEVLNDTRLVSFRYKDSRGELREFLSSFLSRLGYAVERRGGVDFVFKRPEGSGQTADDQGFIYRPQYRDVAYISRVLAPLFKGSFAVNRSVRASEGSRPEGNVPQTSAAALIDQNASVLVFSGVQSEVERLRTMLPLVNTPVGEVSVRGVVCEVSNIDHKGSAFGLLANVLSGRLNIGLGSTLATMGNVLQIKHAGLDAIYSALANDSRFKVLSSPSLRIQSGARGMFSVGQDVPVLGALSFPQGNCQAVQSVEYRSSGVIFDIRPTVREAVVELAISQQLSDFVKTTTGVNNSSSAQTWRVALRFTSVGQGQGHRSRPQRSAAPASTERT